MKVFITLFIGLFSVALFSQVNNASTSRDVKNTKQKREINTNNLNSELDLPDSNESTKKAPIAVIDQYKIITIERDTIVLDTSLTIQKEYKYNYLRKDAFGLLPFLNEGQSYNTLNFGYNSFSALPNIGFKAKQFNYLTAYDVNYYNVATPLTELYFKTVMGQGQSLDAFITLNTSERLNYSIAYKGLRSLGKYVNQLTSTGNFRFTTSYNTKNNKYFLRAHFTSQDMLNQENGGIIDVSNFEGGANKYKDRVRIPVYLEDANSLFKGTRFFVDHEFRINKKESKNNLYINHQFEYEHKFYEYNQETISTQINTTTAVNRFGDSYVLSSLKDQTRYDKLYNKIGVSFKNNTVGQTSFFAEDYYYRFYYNRIIVSNNQYIPNQINDRINTIGGQYLYQKSKINAKVNYTKSISNHDISTLNASLKYNFNTKNNLEVLLQNLNKLPDNNYTLYQSNYINYNWHNNFKNEKINNLEVKANTQFLNASLQVTTINDFLYFSNDATTTNQLLVTPKQYNQTINYLSLKASKEIKFWKLALDNTVLYQKVDQANNILNVPEIVTRNTFYFSDYLFKKAMFIQTGVTLNYFSKYYINDYNPLIGEFFVQSAKKIGDFPTLDFFVNARIKQTRIYLKAEHFNSSTSNNYYSAPNYPYRDFIVRFGLEWNFFQ